MPHPAKYTDVLLDASAVMLDGVFPRCGFMPLTLDPFAGTGKGVEYLRAEEFDAWGVELEPEWAALSPHVIVGSALALPFDQWSFDLIATSPTYGNRMADKDLRESVGGTYAKSLGRLASVDSSCHMQWGSTYRKFHEDAWAEAVRVLRPGGYFLLNCKDHIRGGVLQEVTAWHADALKEEGLEVVTHCKVKCPGMRYGANAAARVDFEWLVLLQKVTY